MAGFSGKVAIITGAGSGIGAALASALLERGASVVLAGRREEKLEAVRAGSRCPERATVVATDVSRYDALERLIEVTASRHGRLDILVNNAGAAYVGPLSEMEPGEVEHSIRVNLLAPIWLSQLAYPLLSRQAGAMIVNIASMAAQMPLPYQSVYCAGKFGLMGFSESLRREGLLGGGVHVMVVYPGTVDTEMLPADIDKRLREMIPGNQGSFSAEEVACSILDGMARRRTSLVIAWPRERILARVSGWFPSLADRSLARMGSGFLEVIRELQRRARSKEAARKVG